MNEWCRNHGLDFAPLTVPIIETPIKIANLLLFLLPIARDRTFQREVSFPTSSQRTTLQQFECQLNGAVQKCYSELDILDILELKRCNLVETRCLASVSIFLRECFKCHIFWIILLNFFWGYIQTLFLVIGLFKLLLMHICPHSCIAYTLVEIVISSIEWLVDFS